VEPTPGRRGMRKKRIAAFSNYFGVDLRNEEVMHWLGMMRERKIRKEKLLKSMNIHLADFAPS
jgi:hypothetical protein